MEDNQYYNRTLRSNLEEITRRSATIAQLDYKIQETEREKNKEKEEILKLMPSGVSFNLSDRLIVKKTNGSEDILSTGIYIIEEAHLTTGRGTLVGKLVNYSASDLGRIMASLKPIL